MPTYEYACSACGHEWEQVQRITEPATEVCPTCAKTTAHRLISGGTNFILKGGGWYSDLYASAKPPKTESEKSDTTSKPAEKSGSDASASDSTAKPAAPKTGPAETAKTAPASTPSTS